MAGSKRIAVILAGGSGTRFWPLSKKQLPKQYLTLFGTRSLIQHTWDRLTRLCRPKDIWVCSSQSQKKLLKKQLPKAGLILEPAACNTGPAVLLSALELLRKGYSRQDLMAVFPADHYISAKDAFHRVLQLAFTAAEQTGGLVTLGIVPESAHTGYGYIEAGPATPEGWRKATRFVEKPQRELAERFVSSGRYFWNSGIFVWQIGSILDAFATFAEKDFKLLEKTTSRTAAYKKVSRLPVDKMILEKSNQVSMVPAVMGWSDVGSWSALSDLKPTDANKNIFEGEKSALIQTRDCLVHAPGKRVALIGMNDIVVVVEGDEILICRKDQDQLVRDAATTLS